MKNIISLLMILVLFSVFGCTPSDSATNLKETEMATAEYVPPADGKITEEQMTRYIATATEMSKELNLISEKMQAFKAKYGITDDAQMDDLSKVKAGAKEEFEAILKEWEQKEKDIYSKNKMTPSEFEWVAAGLTDPLNTDVQKKVEKALSGE